MTDQDLPIKFIVHEDSDDVTIEWDETHPVAKELGLDNWTEEQWLAALRERPQQGGDRVIPHTAAELHMKFFSLCGLPFGVGITVIAILSPWGFEENRWP